MGFSKYNLINLKISWSDIIISAFYLTAKTNKLYNFKKLSPTITKSTNQCVAMASRASKFSCTNRAMLYSCKILRKSSNELVQVLRRANYQLELAQVYQQVDLCKKTSASYRSCFTTLSSKSRLILRGVCGIRK